MRRVLIACCLAAASTRPAAGTVLSGDLAPAGRKAGDEPALSAGVPYLVARAINAAGACDAVLPDSPPRAFIDRCYDAAGLPRLDRIEEECSRAGAGRYLLGRFERLDGGGGASFAVTFYAGGAPLGAPAVFRADVSGADSFPALAEFAAARACPGGKAEPPPRMPAGMLERFSRALILHRGGDTAGALREAEALAEDFPASADARYLAGIAAAGERRPYAALRLFSEAARLDPSFAHPVFREGMVWLSLDRRALAESAFERAARIQPTFVDALREAAGLKARRGEFDAAARLLERALRVRPGDVHARCLLADCLSARGRETEARRLLAGVVAERPSHGPARFGLGLILHRAGDHAAAEVQFREAARLSPDDPEAHRMLGEALSRQGGYHRHGEAAALFRRAILLEERRKGRPGGPPPSPVAAARVL
ncbi:MAG: tetratricopeptide repeat protein [bacterium]|nr:tetratricopeptide repeat protein [bacterium]